MAERKLDTADALKRLHTGTDGLILPKPGGPQWLNTLDTVDGIVRSWASEVLKRYGTDEEAPFMAWLESEVMLMNGLFLGFTAGEERTDYQRDTWNMPENLGRSIGPNMRFDAYTHTAVRDAFMHTAAALIETTADHAGKPIEQWGWQLDAAIEALVHGLLGIPVVEEE